MLNENTPGEETWAKKNHRGISDLELVTTAINRLIRQAVQKNAGARVK